ncbi:hypothetical protein HWB19_gp048 [Cronobacter phage vB_CsaP_009]|uniref:Uncharacterized protein n=1 Tax=Cronobacter phage vB_CsaP_009 TaxID=2699738 RepID=A0A679FBV4_9CAUD|nr:hypothetical protein HWB19_gp048 [Cronobacter phage vB_CsaP_009]BBU72694.1 hypothetical protein [Cronobacter phage vB_CsaP_009]
MIDDDNLGDPRITGSGSSGQMIGGVILIFVITFIFIYMANKSDKNSEAKKLDNVVVETLIQSEIDETYSVNNSFHKGDEDKYGISK